MTSSLSITITLLWAIATLSSIRLTILLVQNHTHHEAALFGIANSLDNLWVRETIGLDEQRALSALNRIDDLCGARLGAGTKAHGHSYSATLLLGLRHTHDA